MSLRQDIFGVPVQAVFAEALRGHLSFLEPAAGQNAVQPPCLHDAVVCIRLAAYAACGLRTARRRSTICGCMSCWVQRLGHTEVRLPRESRMQFLAFLARPGGSRSLQPGAQTRGQRSLLKPVAAIAAPPRPRPDTSRAGAGPSSRRKCSPCSEASFMGFVF